MYYHGQTWHKMKKIFLVELMVKLKVCRLWEEHPPKLPKIRAVTHPKGWSLNMQWPGKQTPGVAGKGLTVQPWAFSRSLDTQFIFNVPSSRCSGKPRNPSWDSQASTLEQCAAFLSQEWHQWQGFGVIWNCGCSLRASWWQNKEEENVLFAQPKGI